MKKLIALAVALVVLVGAGYAYYEYQRRNLRASIDRVIIPYVKGEFKAQTGREMTVSYASAELAGRELLISQLAFEFDWQGRHLVKWEKVRLTARGWSWLWGQYLFDLDASKSTYLAPQAFILVEKSFGRELALDPEKNSLSLAGLIQQGVEIRLKPQDERFKIDELALLGINSSYSPREEKFHTSVKGIRLAAGEFRAEAAGLKLSGQRPGSGDAYSPLGDYDVQFDSARLKKGGKPLLKAGRFQSDHRRTEQGFREAFALEKLGFDIPAKLGDQDLKALHEAGLKRVVLNFSSQMEFSKAGNRTELKSFVLEGEKLGRLELKCLVGDVNPANFKKPDLDDEKIMALLAKAKLISLDLAYHDEGLTPLIYKLVAIQKKQDPKQVKISTAGAVALAAFGVSRDSKKLARVLVSLASFLNKPKAICLSLRPEQPVSVGQLTTPPWQKAVDKLNPEAGDCSGSKKQAAK